MCSGCLYLTDKRIDNKIYWKCDQYKTKNCRARIHTSGDEIIKRVGEHNHADDAALVDVTKVLNKIKEKARETQDETQRTVIDAFASTSQAVIGQMPQTETLKRFTRHTRTYAGHFPPNPLSIKDLNIPKEYRNRNRNEPFLIFDNHNNNRMLIFTTKNNLEVLIKSKVYYADGTFKSVHCKV